MPELPAITFRPLAPNDLPLLHRWQHNPAVARWWHPTASYDDIVAKYLPRIAGNEPVFPFIAEVAGTPFGYLQWYRLADNPGHPVEAWAEAGAAAIDLCIGEDQYRGRGLGTAMLRNFVRAIVFADPDVTSCYLDPHPENVVAIRSYVRAGFYELGLSVVDAAGDVAWLLHIERVATSGG